MIFSHLALGAMYPVAVFFSIALTAGASPALVPRAYNGSGSGLTVVDATWDGYVVRRDVTRLVCD